MLGLTLFLSLCDSSFISTVYDSGKKTDYLVIASYGNRLRE